MRDVFFIGKQQTVFVEPDIIYMKMSGDVTAEEGLAINDQHREYVVGREVVYYLIDFTELESVPAPVRKAASETIKEFPLEGLAIFGAPLKAKVLAKLILTAMKLFKGDAAGPPVAFVDTEEQALAWIEKRRGEVAKKREHAA
ncbi:MAG TPA: STAS/SEC14 domain-containing protein [Thermoanaerobaculia bacterium]|nr:STAS/SEC14 domain-containing protein [Thermoanaerobaculia bacterium]